MTQLRGIRADQLRLYSGGGLLSQGSDGRLAAVDFFGPTPPDNPFDGMRWVDSSANSGNPPYTLRRYNLARTAWEAVSFNSAFAFPVLGLLGGNVDGTNKDFTIPAAFSVFISAMVNGQWLRPVGIDWFWSGPSQITLGSSVAAPGDTEDPTGSTDWVGGLWIPTV